VIDGSFRLYSLPVNASADRNYTTLSAQVVCRSKDIPGKSSMVMAAGRYALDFSTSTAADFFLPSANGEVYIDRVGVGSISYPSQAIGAAAKVSTTFARDQVVDGLMGLAFSKINAVMPKPQLTWFDNVKPKLAAPVFTCALKRRQVSIFSLFVICYFISELT
jgi:hypothetical protein